MIEAMRIIFAGTPDVAVSSLRALVDAGHEVTLVVTREDARVGRKGTLRASAVAEAANELNLPLLKTNTFFPGHEHMLDKLNADIGVIVAYGALVKEPFLSTPRLGWINTHFSLLPKWRGAAPAQHALIAGDSETGVTIFQLDEGLDTGPIITQDSFPIPKDITSGELLTHLSEFAMPMLLRALEMISDPSFTASTQLGEPSYAPKLSRDDGRIDFTEDASVILRRWAGVTPEPGAWTLVDDRPIKLLTLGNTTNSSTTSSLQPGEAGRFGGFALVGTHTEPLELVSVQPAGKLAMSGDAWLRGRQGPVIFS